MVYESINAEKTVEKVIEKTKERLGYFNAKIFNDNENLPIVVEDGSGEIGSYNYKTKTYKGIETIYDEGFTLNKGKIRALVQKYGEDEKELEKMAVYAAAYLTRLRVIKQNHFNSKKIFNPLEKETKDTISKLDESNPVKKAYNMAYALYENDIKVCLSNLSKFPNNEKQLSDLARILQKFDAEVVALIAKDVLDDKNISEEKKIEVVANILKAPATEVPNILKEAEVNRAGGAINIFGRQLRW